jgi:hypothetical protein
MPGVPLTTTIAGSLPNRPTLAMRFAEILNAEARELVDIGAPWRLRTPWSPSSCWNYSATGT